MKNHRGGSHGDTRGRRCWPPRLGHYKRGAGRSLGRLCFPCLQQALSPGSRIYPEPRVHLVLPWPPPPAEPAALAGGSLLRRQNLSPEGLQVSGISEPRGSHPSASQSSSPCLPCSPKGGRPLTPAAPVGKTQHTVSQVPPVGAQPNWGANATSEHRDPPRGRVAAGEDGGARLHIICQ